MKIIFCTLAVSLASVAECQYQLNASGFQNPLPFSSFPISSTTRPLRPPQEPSQAFPYRPWGLTGGGINNNNGFDTFRPNPLRPMYVRPRPNNPGRPGQEQRPNRPPFNNLNNPNGSRPHNLNNPFDPLKPVRPFGPPQTQESESAVSFAEGCIPGGELLVEGSATAGQAFKVTVPCICQISRIFENATIILGLFRMDNWLTLNLV